MATRFRPERFAKLANALRSLRPCGLPGHPPVGAHWGGHGVVVEPAEFVAGQAARLVAVAQLAAPGRRLLPDAPKWRASFAGQDKSLDETGLRRGKSTVGPAHLDLQARAE